MKHSYPNIKFLQLNCYLSAASRTWIENLLPSPTRDGFGGQHRHRCDYFFKPSLPIILRCFLRQPIIANDYFTIITIIGPTINRSDASLKSSSSYSHLWSPLSKILLSVYSVSIEVFIHVHTTQHDFFCVFQPFWTLKINWRINLHFAS